MATQIPERRSFLSRLGWAALLGALATAYGGLAAVFARFLFPARDRDKG